MAKNEKKISARIDLHGFTINEANIRVKHFLGQSKLMEKKYVEIITGKSGEIRREFPMWMEIMGYKIVDSKAGSFIIKTF